MVRHHYQGAGAGLLKEKILQGRAGAEKLGSNHPRAPVSRDNLIMSEQQGSVKVKKEEGKWVFLVPKLLLGDELRFILNRSIVFFFKAL
jgi:hypothetical protein